MAAELARSLCLEEPIQLSESLTLEQIQNQISTIQNVEMNY